MNGKLISFEGIDGAGKSTHLMWLADWLQTHGIKLHVTREPGGTAFGESLRAVLLNQDMSPITETLLMFAARTEHWNQVILPKLKADEWVLSDRFIDASYAYQGGGRGVDFECLDFLHRWTIEGYLPDLTILFDISPQVAAQRVRKSNPNPDRFEQEQDAFFEKVRQAYRQRVEQDPDRFIVVDGQESLSDIQRFLQKMLQDRFCL